MINSGFMVIVTSEEEGEEWEGGGVIYRKLQLYQ